MKKNVTISELLGVVQIVDKRYNELVALRDANSADRVRYYGVGADKPVETKVKYDAVKLDKLVARLAREKRLLDVALKTANATLVVPGYEWDDDVLGELEAADAAA